MLDALYNVMYPVVWLGSFIFAATVQKRPALECLVFAFGGCIVWFFVVFAIAAVSGLVAAA